VQAIFTPTNDSRGKVVIGVGLLVVALGAFFWLASLRSFSDGSSLGITSTGGLFSILFQPLAIILFIGGVGLCTYSFAVRRARQDNYRIEAAVYELQTLIEGKTGVPVPSTDVKPSGKVATSRGYRLHFSKAFGAALVEGVLLLFAYAGLVQEYNSNLDMQGWVRANFGFGGYILSYNSVLLLIAGLLGYSFFQIANRLSPFKSAGPATR